MIFKKIYLENKELKQEVEFYTRENWKKEDRLRDLKKELREKDHRIEELEKELEEIKNEKKSKRKNIRLPKNK